LISFPFRVCSKNIGINLKLTASFSALATIATIIIIATIETIAAIVAIADCGLTETKAKEIETI